MQPVNTVAGSISVKSTDCWTSDILPWPRSQMGRQTAEEVDLIGKLI